MFSRFSPCISPEAGWGAMAVETCVASSGVSSRLSATRRGIARARDFMKALASRSGIGALFIATVLGGCRDSAHPAEVVGTWESVEGEGTSLKVVSTLELKPGGEGTAGRKIHTYMRVDRRGGGIDSSVIDKGVDALRWEVVRNDDGRHLCLSDVDKSAKECAQLKVAPASSGIMPTEARDKVALVRLWPVRVGEARRCAQWCAHSALFFCVPSGAESSQIARLVTGKLGNMMDSAPSGDTPDKRDVGSSTLPRPTPPEMNASRRVSPCRGAFLHRLAPLLIDVSHLPRCRQAGVAEYGVVPPALNRCRRPAAGAPMPGVRAA